MADIEVQYKNATIKTQTGSGTVTLHTEGKYCEDDIDIVYVAPAGGGGAVTVNEYPDSGGGVVKDIIGVDISNDTVDAAHLLSGYTAHDSNGDAVTGTYTPVLEITTGTSSSNTLSGTFTGIKKIEVTAGSATNAKQISLFKGYGLYFPTSDPCEITYSGFNDQSSTLTDYYRTTGGISKVDFGNVKLPASISRFFYGFRAENLTRYIKGLNWTNVTTINAIFQGSSTYTAYRDAGLWVDVEWLGTVNVSAFNICPNNTWEVPFTHRSLVELMSALGSGGGTCHIGTNNLATLTAEEQAVATAKGWTLS